jgi:hypothetical protein
MAKPQHQAATVSPQRAALAQAVAAQHEEHARRESVRAAHAQSIERAFACRDAVEQAYAALEQAKRDAADYAVALAGGKAGAAPMTIRDARARLTDAQDELEAAEATQAALQQQADKVDHTFAPQRLKEAAIAVVQAEAGDHAHAVAEKVAFPWNEEPGLQYHHVQDPNVAAALNRMESPPSTWYELHRTPGLQGHTTWAQTMDLLAQDPNAPLPTK